jgi:hypothetical protein
MNNASVLTINIPALTGLINKSFSSLTLINTLTSQLATNTAFNNFQTSVVTTTASIVKFTQSNFLPLSGGTLTGNFTLSSTISIAPLNISPLTITAAASGSVFNQIQNTVAGVSASTDISLYNNLGSNYLDMGINSSQYNGNIYSPTFNVVGPNDSYFYATSANLGIGNAGTSGGITFFTGGTTTSNTRMVVTNTGNIGIGTTTPNTNLTVVGTVSSTAVVATSALWMNSLSATTNSPGTVVSKMPIYNAQGGFIGWIPVYNG